MGPPEGAPSPAREGLPSRRLAPPQIPHYASFEWIGEGGMGVVYRAVDTRLGRPVAIKVLKLDDPVHSRRFLVEAQAQAQIHHENVCPVYEVGEADGVPFIAMQYIAGPSLAEIGPDLRLPELVAVVRDAAKGLHEAHRLGLVHRDVKPGNILLGVLEDGSYRTYVVDFGLAREVGIRGDTQTGDIVGTPAYMSPEQVRGEWRLTDARSDVFSLGVTLYHALAGHPPFTSDEPFALLVKVANEDVPPLATVKPDVPPALATIVAKCLERDRERRYATAHELADDLQRFLDAKPIDAKDPSIAYLAWKKAKRHPVVVALCLSALAAAIGLGAVLWRARVETARREAWAGELGAALTEMQLFLRTANELPLHDVERERAIVRDRLSEIERRMAEAGDAGVGPGECALGEGYLALGEPEVSRQHLERALAAGYSSSALEDALGQALGELYRRALEDAKRIGGEEERKQRIAELEKTLRDPALAHLRAAAGARIGSPLYTEGLIALYEGRNADAAAKAREAFEKAPWLYEAKKLEGDALFAEGSKYRHDAAFDFERMDGYFRGAEEAYRAAAEIGRSDPSVHLAECDLQEKAGWAAWNKVLPSDPIFAAAEAACARAMAASSKDGRAAVQRALVLAARVSTQRGGVKDSDAAEGALAAARQAVAARPDDLMARYAVARALLLEAQVLYDLGRDASMEEAIDAYQEALDLDPRFTWALNEQGDAFAFEAKRLRDRGEDGYEESRRAIERYEQAMSIDPKFALPLGGLLDALRTQIENDIEVGRDSTATLTALSSAASDLAKGGFGPWLAAFWRARSNRLRAEHELSFGRDPAPALAEAEAAISAFAGETPADYWFRDELARCRVVEARQAVLGGLDPGPAIARARAAADLVREKADPDAPSPRILSASVALLGLQAKDSGADAPRAIDEALALLAPLLSTPGFATKPLLLAAELLALRAARPGAPAAAAEADIERGLALTSAVLAQNPHHARASWICGDLHLLRARAARGAPRAEAARRAREALEAAFRSDPRLAKEHGGAIDEAIRFLR